jgi:hypothetical protein
VHGTTISLRDILATLSRPLASAISAGAFAYGVRLICGLSVPPLVRLLLESNALFVAFFGTLLFVAGQKALYADLLRGLKKPSSFAETISISA